MLWIAGTRRSDVYFEAGDHEQLIRMTHKDFTRLLGDSAHSRFSRHI